MSSLPFQQDRAGILSMVRSSRSQGGGRMVALACVLLSSLPGCGNPSFDVQIENLPDDPPGTPLDRDHRRGQPCLLCHGPYKGAKPQMSLAGTVFESPTNIDDLGKALVPAKGVKGVQISLSDPFGNVNGLPPGAGTPVTIPTETESGNFYVEAQRPRGFAPNFPLGARMDCPNGSQFTMISRISRDGSCNGCHVSRRDQGSPGWLECQPL